MPENVTVIRRRNVLALYKEFAARKLAADPTAQGLEAAFASSLEVSPSTWSMMKGARPIGDKLARQVEVHAGKPAGWLDEEHAEHAAPDAAEEHFLQVARTAWRAANAKGKRDLMRAVRQVPQPALKP